MPSSTLAGSSVSLVMLSALLWAACDFVRKRALALYPLNTVQRASALGQLVLAVAFLLALAPRLPSVRYLPFGVCAAVASIAGTYCFLSALQRAPLSTTIPLLALTPAITAVASWLLGQHLSGRAVLGLALVFSGSFITNPLGKAEGTARSAFGFMTAAALLWSLGSTLDAQAVQVAAVPWHALLCSLAALGASFVPGPTATPTRLTAAHAPWLWGCAIVCAAASLAQWYAVSQAPAGIVEGTKRALGTLSALGLGALLLHEHLGWRRIGGALSLLAGACLLSL